MIRMIQGDITKISDVDAIVNAANKTLLGGGGVDGAIHRAAGKGLWKECVKLHGCKTGGAKITKAYNLPCKYVIHTVGPIWMGGRGSEEDKLAACYRNSLLLALEHDIRRIAFPSISTGAFHFPTDRAADIAVSEVWKFMSEHSKSFDLVEWVLFDEKTYNVYRKQLDSRRR